MPAPEVRRVIDVGCARYGGDYSIERELVNVADVTACLVTRGNVDMQPILDSLPPAWDVVLWDNSVEDDLGVYGRYEAIKRADTHRIYVQDDDCVLEPESFAALEENYNGSRITANMPEPFRLHYSDSCLVGFGAIFLRELPFRAFERLTHPPLHFHQVCDVFFTALTVQKWLDLPYRNLLWATAEDRMYREPSHVGERAEALAFARKVRDGH